MSANQILEDTREIAQLVFENDQSFTVGMEGVTKIEVYGEPGEFCMLPWFAVYAGEEITERVNAMTVSVVRYVTK